MDRQAVKINSLADIPDLSKINFFIPIHFCDAAGNTVVYKMVLYDDAECYAAEFETYDALNNFFHEMTKIFDRKKVHGYVNCVQATELRGKK